MFSSFSSPLNDHLFTFHFFFFHYHRYAIDDALGVSTVVSVKATTSRQKRKLDEFESIDGGGKG